MIKVPRTVRNTLISVVMMVVLFVVVATIYVLVADRNAKTPAPPKSNQASQKASPLNPVAPAANAPEGVALQSLITPVMAGQNTTLQALTNPGSTCTITAVYNNVASHDSGLAPKTADAYGLVSWTWTVDSTAPVGTWPATVTCVYHGRSGVLIGNLQVTK